MAQPNTRLVPVLPRAAWQVLGADALSAVGTGLTLPFLLVYLHTVHGLSLGLAGVAVSLGAVASLAGNPLGGQLADRIGPKLTLCAGLALAGAGAAGLAVVSATWHGLAASALTGFGVSVAWPAQDALLAELVPAPARASAYGLRHATLNFGLGIGSVLAAGVLVLDDSASFALLYWLDAATFLLAIPLVLAVRAPRPVRTHVSGPSGYRALLKDRAFVRLWLLTALLVTVGYGQFSSAFPAFATERAGLDPQVLSLAFAANTVTVVGAQLVMLRLLQLSSRRRALLVLCALWAATWAIVVLGETLDGVATVAAFVLAAAVFGVGETVLAPTVPALANELAPEHLRGRYNGAATLAYTTGFMAGPLLSGFLLGYGLDHALFGGLIAVCGVCALLAVTLERRPLRARPTGERALEGAAA